MSVSSTASAPGTRPKGPVDRTGPRAPQWYVSAINTPTYNYGVYRLTGVERVATMLVGFVAGGFVAYVFFGGLGKDANGAATLTTHVLDAFFVVVGGTIATRVALRWRARRVKESKKTILRRQFRDMLESMSGSLSAGATVIQSLVSAREDMGQQYAQDAPIVKELDLMIAGFHNNVRVEDMIVDFGDRSDCPDITSFATVFRIAYLRGGDMKEAIRNTNIILSEKMSMAEEIETSLAASKNETLIMGVLPIIIVALLKGNGSSSFSVALATPVGVLCTIIAVGLFLGAFVLARRIMNIEP